MNYREWSKRIEQKREYLGRFIIGLVIAFLFYACVFMSTGCATFKGIATDIGHVGEYVADHIVSDE